MSSEYSYKKANAHGARLAKKGEKTLFPNNKVRTGSGDDSIDFEQDIGTSIAEFSNSIMVFVLQNVSYSQSF